MKKSVFILIFIACFIFANDQNFIGSVATAWKLLGKNDRIEVISVKDPKVEGVTCYISYAKKGGTSEIIGLEEDTSDASVSCAQTDSNITVVGSVSKEEDIFSKRSSVLFKKTHVVRMFDEKAQTFVYLVYSDKLVDGSPNNSVSAVPCKQAVGNVCRFEIEEK